MELQLNQSKPGQLELPKLRKVEKKEEKVEEKKVEKKVVEKKKIVKKKKDDYELPEIPDYERPQLEKYEASEFEALRRVCFFPLILSFHQILKSPIWTTMNNKYILRSFTDYTFSIVINCYCLKYYVNCP